MKVEAEHVIRVEPGGTMPITYFPCTARVEERQDNSATLSTVTTPSSQPKEREEGGGPNDGGFIILQRTRALRFRLAPHQLHTAVFFCQDNGKAKGKLTASHDECRNVPCSPIDSSCGSLFLFKEETW